MLHLNLGFLRRGKESDTLVTAALSLSPEVALTTSAQIYWTNISQGQG